MAKESRKEKRKRRAAERQAALTTQVGGGHYKDAKIQHVEFCQMNRIPWCESAAVKYVCRHRQKNGRQDLEKAIHYLELLIAIDYGRTGEAEGEIYDGREVPTDIKPKQFFFSVADFIGENGIPEKEAQVITDIIYHQKNGDTRLMETIKLLKEIADETYGPAAIGKPKKSHSEADADLEGVESNLDGMDLL